MTDPVMPHDYIRDGRAIYERSFAIIQAEADLTRFPADLQDVAVRMIHGCGQIDLAADIGYSEHVGQAARQALRAGAPILVDSEMLARGVTRKRLPADNEVICTLRDPATPALAQRIGNTRSAAALELWGDRLAGAVVAIGNAPTALFHLLDLIAAGAPRPAAIVGIPVGFVGAIESKQALAANAHGLEWLSVFGRRGGSAITASALNALASDSL